MHPTEGHFLIVLNVTSCIFGRILRVNCQIQMNPKSSNLSVFVNGTWLSPGGRIGSQYVANSSIFPRPSSLQICPPFRTKPHPNSSTVAGLEETYCVHPLYLEQPRSSVLAAYCVTYGISFRVPAQMLCPKATCNSMPLASVVWLGYTNPIVYLLSNASWSEDGCVICPSSGHAAFLSPPR